MYCLKTAIKYYFNKYITMCCSVQFNFFFQLHLTFHKLLPKKALIPGSIRKSSKSCFYRNSVFTDGHKKK